MKELTTSEQLFLESEDIGAKKFALKVLHHFLCWDGDNDHELLGTIKKQCEDELEKKL